MKLAPIAQNVITTNLIKFLTESATGDAESVQAQMSALSTELKKDGEDITDDEVQAAMLSALIDADGKVDNIDVSDVDSIKKEIKESRAYLNEVDDILHSIEAVGSVLGNSAFIHILTEGLNKIGFTGIDENKLKARIESIVNAIKKVTGFPAKIMDKAFSWIAKKLGVGELGQKIAGIVGVLLVTIALLALAVYLFPSITSGILIVFAISGMAGKSLEIFKLIKKLIAHIKEHQAEINPDTKVDSAKSTTKPSAARQRYLNRKTKPQ